LPAIRSLTVYFFGKIDQIILLFSVLARSAHIQKAHFHDSEKVKFSEERAERAVAF